MIRADHLSQGQINGFPTYRLKNAKLNSVHARFKGCMKKFARHRFKEGGDEFKALELYLASRAKGLSVNHHLSETNLGLALPFGVQGFL